MTTNVFQIINIYFSQALFMHVFKLCSYFYAWKMWITAGEFLLCNLQLFFFTTGGNCPSFFFHMRKPDSCLCTIWHRSAKLTSVKSSPQTKPKLLVWDCLNLNHELECFYVMPSNPLLLEYVTVLPGPTNATHNLSLSIFPALLPRPPDSSYFLSAAFLLSWNCNRRTKWLANPFLCFLELCVSTTSTVHEMLWYVYDVYVHIQQQHWHKTKSWFNIVCESTTKKQTTTKKRKHYSNKNNTKNPQIYQKCLI